MDRILVALDTSPRAVAVLTAAAGVAGRMGAKLLLFHAVGIPHEVPREAFSMSPEEFAARLDELGKQYVERMKATLPAGIAAETIIEDGVGWRAICAAADRHHVDLVVIGSHGYSGADRLLGTTAAKVVNHATCSVLVVRGRESA